LTTSYPRHAGDVAGSFVHGFARALAGSGHEVEVLAPEPSEPRLGPPPAIDGVRVEQVAYLRPRSLQQTFYGAGVPDNLRADARAWLGPLPFTLALGRAVLARRARWDVVVSHFGVPCGLVAAALRGSRRHVCVLHSADVHALATLPLGAQLAGALIAGCDVPWFVSELGRRRVLDRLPAELARRAAAKSVMQPLGFDPPPSDPDGALRARTRERLGLSRFTLLTIARLVPVKGLLPAIASIAHRGDLEWLIAGDGPERAALAQLAERVRVRVRLLGTVTGADKHALLRAADAFVLPSRVLPSGRGHAGRVARGDGQRAAGDRHACRWPRRCAAARRHRARDRPESASVARACDQCARSRRRVGARVDWRGARARRSAELGRARSQRRAHRPRYHRVACSAALFPAAIWQRNRGETPRDYSGIDVAEPAWSRRPRAAAPKYS
jgi:glycosyltransferase involved in cell wall biosynthesis